MALVVQPSIRESKPNAVTAGSRSLGLSRLETVESAVRIVFVSGDTTAISSALAARRGDALAQRGCGPGRPRRRLTGSRCLDEVNERPQWRRHQASSGIVEKRPRKSRPPGFKDGLKRAAVEMRAQPVLE